MIRSGWDLVRHPFKVLSLSLATIALSLLTPSFHDTQLCWASTLGRKDAHWAVHGKIYRLIKNIIQYYLSTGQLSKRSSFFCFLLPDYHFQFERHFHILWIRIAFASHDIVFISVSPVHFCAPKHQWDDHTTLHKESPRPPLRPPLVYIEFPFSRRWITPNTSRAQLSRRLHCYALVMRVQNI